MRNNLEFETVQCPVCEHGRSREWLNDGKPTRYMRCLDCGMVYASPRASRASRYTWLNSTFSLDDGIFNLTASRRPALLREANLIQQHVRSGRLLDVGCSIGAFFEFFPPDRWERHGVELSSSAAKYAAERYQADVSVGLLHEVYYPDAHFDLVTLIDTLYYVDDPVAEITEIHRILKPGGWLAIEIAGQAYILWRNYGLLPWLFEKRWSRASTDSSYIYWFGPQALRQLLVKCNFQPKAWYVIPSPKHGNIMLDSLAGLHFVFLDALSKLSPRTLTWAPKYICLANRNEDRS